MSIVKLIWTSKANATDAKGRPMRAGLEGGFEPKRADRLIANGFAKAAPKPTKPKASQKEVKDGDD